MEISRFYHTSDTENIQAEQSLLLDNGYSKLDSSIYDRSAPKLIVIDTERRQFWISDQKSLDECKEITHLHYCKEINPTTFKELQLWLD